MTSLLGGRIRRSDLAHGDERLFPSATFSVHHATVSMRPHDAEGLLFLLNSVLDSSAAPTTVCMYLEPRGYHPEQLSPPEFPPSNLIFGVDQGHGVAAAALLAFDRDHRSHQWLSRGDAWRADAEALAMDLAVPDDTPFPRDAYITVPQLREVVSQWAWGDDLPPGGADWRQATEREVRWTWI